MTILLPSLAVAFAAFCVWLTVRLINRRERWAKWMLAIVVIAGLIAYPLSIGPIDWMLMNGQLSPQQSEALRRFYTPLRLVVDIGPHQIGDALMWYSTWCVMTLDEWTESSDSTDE